LEVTGRQVGAPTTRVTISGSSLSAEVNVAEPRGLHPAHLVLAPRTLLILLFGTSKTKNMFAWYHPAIDEDRFETLVAAVDHGVQDLLANQINLMVPI